MTGGEAGQGSRQEVVGDRFDDRQPDGAAPQFAEVVEPAPQFDEALVAVIDMDQQHRTRFGQAHAPGRAFEQRHAKLPLELRNLPADRARYYVEDFSGMPQRPRAGDFGKISECLGLQHPGLATG